MPTKKTYRKLKLILIVVIQLYVVSAWCQDRNQVNAHSLPFPGIAGPDSATPILPPDHTSWTEFSSGSASRAVILLTDTASAWLGLAHALETIGVPFMITRDYSEAVKHHTLIVYPVVSGKVLSSEALHALVNFAHSGGTLVANDVLGGGLNQVFGFTDALPSRTRFFVQFVPTSLTSTFTDSLERTIRLGDPLRQKEALGTIGYTNVSSPVARFEDGTAAITRRVFDGGGSAIALGVDIGALCLLSHDGRDEFIARQYADGYEPVLDVFLRLLRHIYVSSSPDAITLGTVPEGCSLTVLFTHDIDYRYSLGNALTWAKFESENSIPATYFMQTKYITDWEDIAFFDSLAMVQLHALDSMGMEIGSHTVAHARTFNTMPTGSGDERYPAYRPRIISADSTIGATVMGELRVSKFLIETAIGKPIVSFRPGYLRNPQVLPQALAASGYKYSSSFTADNALSHLPLHLNWNRQPGEETNNFDFPVTIEDEELPPLMERLPEALHIADRLSIYGGLFVVLLHTNVIHPKIDFERELWDSLKSRAWFGTVRQFGDFWASRSAATVDVYSNGNEHEILLTLPLGTKGLLLRVPQSWKFIRVSQTRANVLQVPAGVIVSSPAGIAQLFFSLQ